MKAVTIHSDGAIRWEEWPSPQIGPGLVRIRVAAAAINPTDLAMRTFGKLMTGVEGPWVPGMDAAGVVDAVDEGSRFRVGQRVACIVVPDGVHSGAQAEYVVVPEASVIAVPDHISLAEAATIPMNAVTALLALEQMQSDSDRVVAVTGGAGHLATIFTALATARGMTVIADAAPSEMDTVRDNGASFVVPRGPGLSERIRAIVPNGVDAVLDTALLGAEVLPALADGGMIIAVRPTKLVADRGIQVRTIWVSSWATNAPAIREVEAALAGGTLVGRAADVVPANTAESTYGRFAQGGVRGRLVLSFTTG